MEKQQKIVEMAKDICRQKLNCNDVCNPISACDALRYAERAVEAGYVKQSEGEWKGNGSLQHCSECGNVVNFNDVSKWLYNFCPYCGAKMKGGE